MSDRLPSEEFGSPAAAMDVLADLRESEARRCGAAWRLGEMRARDSISLLISVLETTPLVNLYWECAKSAGALGS